MKKIYILLVIALSTFGATSAQTKFNFFGGVALPMGEYAAEELNGDGGYAKLGSSFGLQLDFFLPSNIGFGVAMGTRRNPFNDVTFGEDIVEDLDYTSTRTLATGSYKSFSVMPVFGYKFIDRNDFTWDIMAGFGAALNSMTQPVTLELTEKAQPLEQVYIDFSGKYSFAANIGTRFVYYLSPSLGISAAVNFYSSNPEYTIVRQDFTDYNNPELLTTNTYTNRNQILDFTVGIVFGK